MSDNDRQWRERYQELVRFRGQNPLDWPKSSSDSAAEKKLASWCYTQRISHRKMRLSFQRVLLLDEIGFPWTPKGFAWSLQLEMLHKFRLLYPERWPAAREEFPVGNALGSWCDTQRAALKCGSLEPQRRDSLEQIGFPWDVLEANWQENLDFLKEYRRQNPHRWPLFSEEFPSGNPIGIWCVARRQAFAAGTLESSKIKQLEGIDFPWTNKDERWLRQFAYLKEYRVLHPFRWPVVSEEWPIGNRLGSWCFVQRRMYKQDLLSSDRIAHLDQICFPWKLSGKAK